MDSQSLYQILYIFLDWHPARIKTFAELICAVVKAKTVRIKELALYVASKGNLSQSFNLCKFIFYFPINHI